MEVRGRVVVVTGGASGIGRALATRFAAEGAAAVVIADQDADGADAVATEIGGLAIQTDVSREDDVATLVARATREAGPIDLFCSNAGIGGAEGGPEVANDAWQRIWDINVMAHVYAARHVLPDMLQRGEGYLLNTASAAGLLTNLGNLTYTVTKHAAVGLAEWLAITYGDRGIRVSCLCPQGVRTPMLLGGIGATAGNSVLAGGGMIEPEDVAQAVIEGIAAERFLILPHPEVADYVRRKADDPDRWLAGMRRLLARVHAGLAGGSSGGSA
ncbi:MAG TPA: SDR family oxidoreductase [Thermoleophilia bacterium]|nr:SDR family oxidoreductase [Thermoleophilia bacterium]